MELILVRHADAVDVGEGGARTDGERMLSAKGRRNAAAAGRGLRALGCSPERILSSPLVRARETAEGIASAVDLNAIEVADELDPVASVRTSAKWLAEQPEVATVVVGHMPQLSELTALLVEGGARLVLDYKKAGACCIVFDGPVAVNRGRLTAFLPPKVLRLLKQSV